MENCLPEMGAMLIILLCVQATGALEFASQLNSSDITHRSAVLSWQLPTNVSLVSEYRLTIIEGNDGQEERVIPDPYQTSYELKGLEIWTNYTVILVTYNLTHDTIGASWHSFSTTFFFVNVKTLVAVGMAIFIFICYVLALAFNFTCNLDKDENEWRKIMIADFDRKRRARKARAEKRRMKHHNRSIKRQVSSLLGFRKTEDSTDYEDSITTNSIKSSSSTEINAPVVKEEEVKGQENEHDEITNDVNIEIDLTSDVTRQRDSNISDRISDQDDVNNAIRVLDTSIENIEGFNMIVAEMSEDRDEDNKEEDDSERDINQAENQRTQDDKHEENDRH